MVLLELMAIAKKDSVFVSKRQGRIQVYGKGGVKMNCEALHCLVW